jgi:hypothetical protein
MQVDVHLPPLLLLDKEIHRSIKLGSVVIHRKVTCVKDLRFVPQVIRSLIEQRAHLLSCYLVSYQWL